MRSWFIFLAVGLAGCPPGEISSLLGVEITSPSGPVFTNGTVELTLKATGGPDKVVVLRDGEEVATVSSPYEKVSLDTTAWTEGAHQVVARASLKTATADSATLVLNVDRTAPKVLWRWPEGSAWWSDGFGVVLDEPVTAAASVLTVQTNPAPGQLSADGRTYTARPSPGYSTVPFSAQVALAAGSLTDLAGNTNTAATWSFDIPRWAKTSLRAGQFARVAVDSSGASYVAFTERDMQTDRVAVSRVTAGRDMWLPSPGAGSFPAVAVDATGRAVVAWQTASDVIAARWENGAWVMLGTVGAGAFPDVAFDAAGNPVVAFTDLGGPMRMGPRTLHVSKWNGSAWASAAADVTTAGVGGLGDPSGPSLVMDGDTPVVAYVEVVAGVATVKVTGASMGLNVQAKSAARWPRLAAKSGQLFLAWEEEDDAASTVHVAQRTNGTWARLGRPLDVDLTRRASWPAIALDSSGAPIVTWAEESHWGRWTMPIARFSQGAWSFLGGEEVAGGSLPFPGGIAVYGDAPLVALHQLEGSAQTVTVRRYNGAGISNPFGIVSRAAASTCTLGLETGTPRSSLAATTCFDLTQMPPRAAADLVPYDLNSPLWSDGALKRRWVRLPAGQTLGYTGRGAFDFPIGTMVVKEFSYVQTPGDGTTRRPVETRFLVKRDDAGWEGFSYQWAPTFSDATLLDEVVTKRVSWPYAGGDGGHVQIYPTRTDCGRCHQAAAGDILGPQAGQLNRSFDYGGIHDNQLRTLEHLGLFGGTSTADAGRFTNPHDTTEPLYRRVRGYLAANCAQCHRPGGARPTRDFRWETALEDTHICDAGSPFGQEITPGDGANSLMTARMSGIGQRMPPLATDVIDDVAVALVTEWIDSLTECRE